MRHVLLPVLLTMQHTVMMIYLYLVEGGITEDKNVKNALTFISVFLGRSMEEVLDDGCEVCQTILNNVILANA